MSEIPSAPTVDLVLLVDGTGDEVPRRVRDGMMWTEQHERLRIIVNKTRHENKN